MRKVEAEDSENKAPDRHPLGRRSSAEAVPVKSAVESMSMVEVRLCEVLLSLQRALLGAVGVRLRAVTVGYAETSVHFDAYFDGAVDEDDREAMSQVETEVMADFPSSHSVTHTVIRLDAPEPIPKDCTWVYFRKEALSATP